MKSLALAFMFAHEFVAFSNSPRIFPVISSSRELRPRTHPISRTPRLRRDQFCTLSRIFSFLVSRPRRSRVWFPSRTYQARHLSTAFDGTTFTLCAAFCHHGIAAFQACSLSIFSPFLFFFFCLLLCASASHHTSSLFLYRHSPAALRAGCLLYQCADLGFNLFTYRTNLLQVIFTYWTLLAWLVRITGFIACRLPFFFFFFPVESKPLGCGRAPHVVFTM